MKASFELFLAWSETCARNAPQRLHSTAFTHSINFLLPSSSSSSSLSTFVSALLLLLLLLLPPLLSFFRPYFLHLLSSSQPLDHSCCVVSLAHRQHFTSICNCPGLRSAVAQAFQPPETGELLVLIKFFANQGTYIPCTSRILVLVDLDLNCACWRLWLLKKWLCYPNNVVRFK